MRLWLIMVCAVCPGAARAHAPVPGIEGFYIGVIHPLSTPSQLLAILAIGLLAGGRWPEGTARALLGFFLALLGGLVLVVFTGTAHLGTATLAVAIVTSALAALLPSPDIRVVAGLAILSGLVLGAASLPDRDSLAAMVVTTSGSVIGATVILLYLAGGIGELRGRIDKAWFGIGLRILSAWIAAIAAMLLALHFRGAVAAVWP